MSFQTHNFSQFKLQETYCFIFSWIAVLKAVLSSSLYLHQNHMPLGCWSFYRFPYMIYLQCLQVIPGTTLTPILHSSFSLLLWLLPLHMKSQQLHPFQLFLCQTNWTALICSCKINLHSRSNLSRLFTFSGLVSTLLDQEL